MVTLGNLMQKMVSGKLTPQSAVKQALYTNFHKVSEPIPGKTINNKPI